MVFFTFFEGQCEKVQKISMPRGSTKFLGDGHPNFALDAWFCILWACSYNVVEEKTRFSSLRGNRVLNIELDSPFVSRKIKMLALIGFHQITKKTY